MSYGIVESKCAGCGACAEACPQEAIQYSAASGVYCIRPEACIDCGSCESSCPNGAIRPSN